MTIGYWVLANVGSGLSNQPACACEVIKGVVINATLASMVNRVVASVNFLKFRFIFYPHQTNKTGCLDWFSEHISSF